MCQTDAVIDLSHCNGAVDFQAVKNSGILGVIHKATEGVGWSDPNYASNRAQAAAAGLLWGAYHFGTGSDPVQQADDFLATAQANPGDLLVLDFEPNPDGTEMTLDQARTFVTRVHDRTGRWVGLYSGVLIKELLGSSQDPVLANCWLWLAQYGPSAEIPPNWAAWTMWQYTDGGQVDGISTACDRDRFNGSADELATFWSGGVIEDTEAAAGAAAGS